MLFFWLFAILVSATWAQDRCCINRQYEATFGEIGGAVYSQDGKATHNLINGQNVMHYDYYNRKLGMENTLFFANGTNSTTDILVDYQTDHMYVKVGGQCYLMANTVETSYVEQCIPDSALHIESSYVGFGVSEIPFTTWQFLEPKNGNVIRLSVTDEGCIPIFESVFGTVQKGSTDLVFIITGFRPGIRNTNLMVIPQQCIPIPANDLPANARRAVEKFERLSTLY